MAEIKTLKNSASASDFIATVEDPQKRLDSEQLLKLFSEITKQKPIMWGTSIIGFGSYHYKSERSRQEGDWPLTAFSPRKQNISIYIMPGFPQYQELLQHLGKYKISQGSCLYIKRLADVDLEVLRKLIHQSYEDMKKRHKIA